MARWRVTGVDRDTAADARLDVEAESELQAVKLAGRAILIERVNRLPDPPVLAYLAPPVAADVPAAVAAEPLPVLPVVPPRAANRWYRRPRNVVALMALVGLAWLFGSGWLDYRRKMAFSYRNVTRDIGQAFALTEPAKATADGGEISVSRSEDGVCTLRVDRVGDDVRYAHLAIRAGPNELKRLAAYSSWADERGAGSAPTDPKELAHARHLWRFVRNVTPAWTEVDQSNWIRSGLYQGAVAKATVQNQGTPPSRELTAEYDPDAEMLKVFVRPRD